MLSSQALIISSQFKFKPNHSRFNNPSFNKLIIQSASIIKYPQHANFFKQYGFHLLSVLGKKQGRASCCSSSSSSSSSSPIHDHHSWTYDVFLSFRGVDTRNNIVSHLCRNLDQKGIKTFIDNEGLGTGDEISPALQKAIQESRISIVIFSENYASSGWCLEELVSILDCKESKQQLVYPVFYKVDPSDVRHQRGGFGLALAHHESRLKDNSEKVMRWREALTKASNLSGLHFIDGSHESTFIDTIVERISAQLLDRLQLSVAKYPVGIEPRVEDVLKLLCVGEDDVRMVGIWGIGGIGKTTIAKGVYNSIAHNFEGSCFLQNVRERSIRYWVYTMGKELKYTSSKLKFLEISNYGRAKEDWRSVFNRLM